MKVYNLFRKICVLISNNEQYIKILRKRGVNIGNGFEINKTAIFGSKPYLISIGNNVRITEGCALLLMMEVYGLLVGLAC